MGSAGSTTAPSSQPSIKYLPWLISPHPTLQNLLAEHWNCTTTYVIFPVCMWWELCWDGNGAHCLSWEESKEGGGLTPRFTILVLCQLTPRWTVFLWLFLHMFYFSEEALALLRANCGSRRCTSEIRNPEQTQKAAKRWQQSVIVRKRHQALPWHTKTRVSWDRSRASIPWKGRIQTKQQAGCKEQAWLLPWKSANQQSCVPCLCMTNTIQHLDWDQTKLINNKLINNIHNARGH